MTEHDMSDLHFMEKAPMAEHDVCQIFTFKKIR